MQMHFYRGSVFHLRNPRSHWLHHRSKKDEHTATWNCSSGSAQCCWRELPACSIPCSLCYLKRTMRWVFRTLSDTQMHAVRSAKNRLAPSHVSILLQLFSSDASAQSMIWLHQDDVGIQEPSAHRCSEDKHDESEAIEGNNTQILGSREMLEHIIS